MAGIAALAYHFPRHSVKAEAYAAAWGYFAGRGIREKTVAGYDEDEVTLGLAAALQPSASEEIGYLAAASAGGPRMATTLLTALGRPAARKADFTGSSNASGEALLSCLDFVESRHETALLVAAHRARGVPGEASEHPEGAAGVALLLSPEGGLEVRETAVHTREALGDDVTDAAGRRKPLTVADPSAAVVSAAVGEVLADGDEVWAACHEPDGRFARRVLSGLVDANRVGGNVVERSGDTGCASPLLALAEVLSGRRKGDDLLLVTYGGGSSVALRLHLGARPALPPPPRAALAEGRVYLDYLRYAQFQRFLAGPEPPSQVAQGAYLSLPSYLDTAAARYRLEAARCEACDHLHFPPRPVCLACGGTAFRAEALSGRGEVHARTVIGRGSAPTEFREQQDLVGEYAVCLVDLEEGPRIIAQITDADPEEVDIGAPVEMVVRRLYRQEGVVRYGYKFRLRRG